MIQPQQATPYSGTELPGVEIGTLSSYYPLAEKARAHVDREVVVHIVSGVDFTGRLQAVDDDGVLTVVDGDDVYEIDSDKVAALETQRQR